YDRSPVRDSYEVDSFSSQPVRADDPDARIRLGDSHHPLQAVRGDPVVRLHHLAVRALRAHRLEGPVVVVDRADELVVALVADSPVRLAVSPGDRLRVVVAGVVDDHVLPLRMRLPEDALDALGEERLPVVNRGQHADERYRHGRSLSAPRLSVN